jgi:hypothetical protein
MTHLYQSLLYGERRKVRRSRTLKAAKIVFNEKSSVIDCMARNLSAHGARLQMTSVIGIPEHFNLLIDGTARPAKVIWRASNEIGVVFLEGRPGILRRYVLAVARTI